jgi:hypothetical protein
MIRFGSSNPILRDVVTSSGLMRVGEFPRLNPGLSFLGHFGPQIRILRSPFSLRFGDFRWNQQASASGCLGASGSVLGATR